jgi:hypothetical protein
MNGEINNSYKMVVGSLTGRDYTEDLDVKGKI